MKLCFYLSILLLACICTFRTSTALETREPGKLVIWGEVTQIGPSPGYGSGGVQAYQLIKYRVLNVCEGDYQKQEIVVDHLLLGADDLEDIRVGDRLCIGVAKVKSKEMLSRWSDNVLRRHDDVIETFYVENLGILIRNCRCSEKHSMHN